jgi:hypothetical protein
VQTCRQHTASDENNKGKRTTFEIRHRNLQLSTNGDPFRML